MSEWSAVAKRALIVAGLVALAVLVIVSNVVYYRWLRS